MPSIHVLFRHHHILSPPSICIAFNQIANHLAKHKANQLEHFVRNLLPPWALISCFVAALYLGIFFIFFLLLTLLFCFLFYNSFFLQDKLCFLERITHSFSYNCLKFNKMNYLILIKKIIISFNISSLKYKKSWT